MSPMDNSSKVIRIIQWNCRSASSNLPNLLSLIKAISPHILVLYETWLQPGQIFSIPNYHCIREDRGGRGGGIAILLQKNQFTFSINPHTKIKSVESLAIEVVGLQHTINILA